MPYQQQIADILAYVNDPLPIKYQEVSKGAPGRRRPPRLLPDANMFRKQPWAMPLEAVSAADLGVTGNNGNRSPFQRSLSAIRSIPELLERKPFT